MEYLLIVGVFVFLLIVAFWFDIYLFRTRLKQNTDLSVKEAREMAVSHSKGDGEYRNPYIGPGPHGIGLPSRAWHEYDQVFWTNVPQ